MSEGQWTNIERAASYEIMRTSILTAYLNHPDNFNKAFVFAWYHRMYALGLAVQGFVFNDGHEHKRDKVEQLFTIITNLAEKKAWDRLAYDRLCAALPMNKDVFIIVKYLTMSGKLSDEIVEAIRVNIPDGSDLWSFGKEDIKFPS